MAETDLYLGIDVGGTKTAAGIVTSTGEVLARLVLPTVKNGPEEFVRSVAGMISRMAGGGSRPRACGVALPAYLDREHGVVKWCPNIPALNDFPLVAELGKVLGVPVILEYDGHALTLGEYWKGCGAGSRSMIFLSIGTGIGGGMIFDGKLYRGASGTAGAFGWMIVDPEWLDHPNESCGNLEFEASGTAYNRKASSRASSAKQEVMTYLGMAVSTLVSALSPDVVVVGGGFGVSLGQPFVELLTNMISRYSAPYAAKVVRVYLSSLGTDAGIIGSARSAMLLQNGED